MPRYIRRASERWRTLTLLMNAFERCFAQNCKLDNYEKVHNGAKLPMDRNRIEAQIDTIDNRLGIELSKLTSEMLMIDLAHKERTYGLHELVPIYANYQESFIWSDNLVTE